MKEREMIDKNTDVIFDEATVFLTEVLGTKHALRANEVAGELALFVTRHPKLTSLWEGDGRERTQAILVLRLLSGHILEASDDIIEKSGGIPPRPATKGNSDEKAE